MAREPKNIWIAAGDGDLDRVRVSLSPNVPDVYTYTPMHAAASYGQMHVLDYLISRGGDVNITDADGDTPLYTVENLETARYLVQHGAIVARQNMEGVSPIEHLTEDFPEIADYLRSTLDPSSVPFPQATAPPSQHSQEMASERLTTSLMSSVQEIMQRAEAEGRDPEEELTRAVGRHVLEGVVTGYGMGTENDNARGNDSQSDTPAKRPRPGEESG
ncbi:ankyrin repeat-containing domain protein [Gymnopilus junonius]|uniref:Ankyrin repeat-containing domain protein n=1 Tax=Gymnopilus junonius TaxID=109634 RepID=A0A9P5NMB8_GYMJU|nr:ankyrin repeat-containing domain protein [Gymnopilus junonius]